MLGIIGATRNKLLIMSGSKANIKVIVAAGVPAPDAIRSALNGSLAEFAVRHGFPTSHVSRCIHGRQRHERIRAALAVALNVDREWLDNLLDSHRAAA